MFTREFSLLVLFSLWLLPTLAFASVEHLSEAEFRSLAAELAPKVNLFREVWQQDSEAEFYGGTSRDFLYWLKGRFTEARTRADAQKVIDHLKQMTSIDVQSFIVGNSDIDIVSKKPLSISPLDFGVRKIDTQPVAIFDPASEAGFNELHQGYAPAEKIRLGKKGVIKSPALGDGTHEIFSGKLTVHFATAEEFAKTSFAQQKLNHPSLLALRYLRLLAFNYFQTFGKGFPDLAKLQASMDQESAEAVKKIIQEAVASGELSPFLENQKFRSWANGSIQKAFRSYTNPTAALELMKIFGVDKLIARHSRDLEPINQYVFALDRDLEKIAKNFKMAGIKAESVYLNPKDVFPDLYLYHGTGSDEAFRGILFQGVLPSVGGSADSGLYGVDVTNQAFAEEYRQKRDLLLKFPVKPTAKIIDLNNDPGKKLWESYQANGGGYDKFAEAYGADILIYPYHTRAMVVKNSAALGNAEGVYRQLLRLEDLLVRAKNIHDPATLFSLIDINRLNLNDAQDVVRNSAVSIEAIRTYGAQVSSEHRRLILRLMTKRLPFQENKEMIKQMIGDPNLDQDILTILNSADSQSREELLPLLFEKTMREEVEKTLYRYFTKNEYWPKNFNNISRMIDQEDKETLRLFANYGFEFQTRALDPGFYRALFQIEKKLKHPELITEADTLMRLLDLNRMKPGVAMEIALRSNISASSVEAYLLNCSRQNLRVGIRLLLGRSFDERSLQTFKNVVKVRGTDFELLWAIYEGFLQIDSVVWKKNSDALESLWEAVNQEGHQWILAPREKLRDALLRELNIRNDVDLAKIGETARAKINECGTTFGAVGSQANR